MNAQNHRIELGPIETCNSAAKVAVLNAKTTDEGWDPERLGNSGPKVAVLYAKTTNEGWDQYRLVILN